jgi:hypothetical protein
MLQFDIAESYRCSRLFLYLCGAMIQLVHHMGAQYMTASTGLTSIDILGFHSGSGMQPLGFFRVDGSEQQISALHLPPVIKRINTIKHHIAIDIDSALATELRRHRYSQRGQ